MGLEPPSAQRLGPGESQGHDVLRLLLVVQVVFGHMAAVALPNVGQLASDIPTNWATLAFRMVFRFGPQAAYTFVFLSGFMVAGPLIAGLRQRQLVGLRPYLVRRVRRILPISVGALCLTVLLDTVSRWIPGAESIYEIGHAYDLVAAFNWVNFVGNVLLLQPVFVDAFGSNGPLWTLGYIVQFYVVGWFIAKASNRGWGTGACALMLAVALMTAIRGEWGVLFVVWLAGGVARQLQAPTNCRWPFLVFATMLFVTSNLVSPIISAALAVPVGVLAVLGMRSMTAGKSSSLTRIRAVSSQSYIVYAVHYPALMFVFVSFAALQWPIVSTLGFSMFVLVSVLAVGVVSALLRVLIEIASSRVDGGGVVHGRASVQ